MLRAMLLQEDIVWSGDDSLVLGCSLSEDESAADASYRKAVSYGLVVFRN